MPMRLSAASISGPEIALSLALLVVGLVAVTRLARKIYRIRVRLCNTTL